MIVVLVIAIYMIYIKLAPVDSNKPTTLTIRQFVVVVILFGFIVHPVVSILPLALCVLRFAALRTKFYIQLTARLT